MRNTPVLRGLSVLCVLLVGGREAMAAPLSKPEVTPGDTFQPYVYTSLLYDSNLLRFADETEAQEAINQDQAEELITRAGMGLLMEVPLSLQVLRADVWLEAVNYQEFDDLNHFAGGGRLAWDWELGRRWNGRIDAGYQQGISQFRELQTLEKDIRQVSSAHADAAYSLLPDWQVMVGTSTREVRYDFRDFLDRRVTDLFTELRYFTARRTRVGIRAQTTRGDLDQRQQFDNQSVDNDYKQQKYSLVLGWEASADAYFIGHLGYARRDHEEIPARDFDGFTTRMEHRWRLTPATGVHWTIFREPLSLDDQIATFAVSRGGSVSPYWSPTSWWRLSMLAGYENNRYEGLDGIATAESAREDDLWRGRISTEYRFIRGLALQVGVEVGERNSTIAENDFEYEMVFGELRYGI